MTEQQYKDIKKVLADAPECTQMYGLTLEGWIVPLYQCDESYQWLYWTDFEWSPTDLEIGEQLIKPVILRTMVEQYEEIQALKAKVAELEQWKATALTKIKHISNAVDRALISGIELKEQADGN